MSKGEEYFDGMPESYWRERREEQACPANWVWKHDGKPVNLDVV